MATIPPEYIVLGEFARSARKGLGLRLLDVAESTHVTASYISQVENGKTRAADTFVQKLERALELRDGILFIKIGKPSFDMVKTLMEPAPSSRDPLSEITEGERQELIRYLNFLRVQEQIRQLSA